MTEPMIPSPWPAPTVVSYLSHGRTMWAWTCNGGPGCDGHEGVRGFRAEELARQGWRAHVRRAHQRTRPPAATPNSGAAGSKFGVAADAGEEHRTALVPGCMCLIDMYACPVHPRPRPSASMSAVGPACACDHDGLDREYHLDGCPVSGRPLPTPEQAAEIDAFAQQIAAVTERLRSVGPRHPDLPPVEPTPEPGRAAWLPPSTEECPPGVHSMFDHCTGTCGWEILPLTCAGVAQDERGLLIPAYDQWDRDYEVRLTPESAVELAAELVWAVDEHALDDAPADMRFLHREYLAGYRDAMRRVRQALRINTEEQP